MRTGAPVPRRSASGMESGPLGDAPRRARAARGREVRPAPTCTPASPAACVSPSVASTSRSRSRSPALSSGRPSPRDTVVIGELGLGGEVRSVPQLERRLARGGAARVSRGRSSRRAPRDVLRAPGLEVVPVSSVGHAVEQALIPAGLTPGEPGVASAILVASPSTEQPRGRGRRRARPTAIGSHDASPSGWWRRGRSCARASTASCRRAWARSIVVGDGPDVLSVCSGGFLLDAEFTPQRLSELAKMDGAIILASDTSRVARANVHLVPDPNVPTSETGTRHRTAERVARQLDVPVHHGVGGHVAGRDPPAGREAHARAHPARAGPGRPGAADPRPLQVPARCGERLACRRSRWRTS